MSLDVFYSTLIISVATTMCKRQALFEALWILYATQILIFRHVACCMCSRIYSFCSYQKQLKGELESITLVMLAVHEQVVRMSSTQSKKRLLFYIHERFTISPYFFVISYYICGCYNKQATIAVKNHKHLICYLLTFQCFAHCLLLLLLSDRMQLNGNLKGINFVILAVHEQKELINTLWSKTPLPLHVMNNLSCHCTVHTQRQIDRKIDR